MDLFSGGTSLTGYLQQTLTEAHYCWEWDGTISGQYSVPVLCGRVPTLSGARGASATELSSVQTAIDAFASDTGTDIAVQAISIDVLTEGAIASLGNNNLTGYLRLPNGATRTTDCYRWDTDGFVTQSAKVDAVCPR